MSSTPPEADHVAVREAREDDEEAIWRILVDVFAGEQAIPAEWNAIDESREPQWWCAELGSTVVGVAAAWRDAGEVHWGRYAVRPDVRGLRIGTQLARHSFDSLFGQGIEEIHLEARDTTVRIIRGLGGRVTGEPVPFFVGTVTPMILTRDDYVSVTRRA